MEITAKANCVKQTNKKTPTIDHAVCSYKYTVKETKKHHGGDQNANTEASKCILLCLVFLYTVYN